jgi:hypothetical protein
MGKFWQAKFALPVREMAGDNLIIWMRETETIERDRGSLPIDEKSS